MAELMGMGLVITFGHPRARKDDAERACVRRSRYRRRSPTCCPVPQVALALRIGAATGPVVVQRTDHASEPALVGNAPELAAILRAGFPRQARVTIADRTRRLLGGLFDCIELEMGQHDLRPAGRGASLARRRPKAGSMRSARYHLSPMMGREHEPALLLERWAEAQAGEGRAVMLSGESGIGKSRLVEALRAQLADTVHIDFAINAPPPIGTGHSTP